MEYYLYIIISILILPGLIYGTVAEARVKSTFNKFDKVESNSKQTAHEVARKLLNEAGLEDVEIKQIKGNLTDNYNPKKRVLSLSDSTYNSTSIAAIGVAAHEVGHAVQHKEKYLPLRLRSFLVPIVNIATKMFAPLFIIGIIVMVLANTSVGETLIWISVGFYGGSTLFYLVTLPVEFNASKRALALLEQTTLDETEVPIAKKVLNAAAQTYVATLIISALYFLKFFLYIFISIKKEE